MGIFFGLGNVQLLLAKRTEVFAECVVHVVLAEKHVNASERRVVRRHAIVLQILDAHQAVFRHVLLSERNSDFLSTVGAIVEENHHIAFLDGAIYGAIIDWLDKFVGNTCIVTCLNGIGHRCGLFALAANQQVVSELDAVPVLVAVHCIVATHNRHHLAGAFGAVLFNFSHIALAALRVGVATIHKAVDKHVFEFVALGNVAKCKDVVKRRVHTTSRSQAHEVNVLAVFLGIRECALHLRIVVYSSFLYRFVNLHKVLIKNAAGTNILVSHLRVTHLSVRQTNIFATGLQLRVWIISNQTIPIGCWS